VQRLTQNHFFDVFAYLNLVNYQDFAHSLWALLAQSAEEIDCATCFDCLLIFVYYARRSELNAAVHEYFSTLLQEDCQESCLDELCAMWRGVVRTKAPKAGETAKTTEA
jgi:hypothetical protein